MKKLLILLVAASSIIASCSKKESVDSQALPSGQTAFSSQHAESANVNAAGVKAQAVFSPVKGLIATGDYVIRNKHSMRVLDLKDWNVANGGLIQQWDFANSTNQVFRLTKVRGENSGLYTIDVPIAGHRRLDVKDHSKANGAVIQIWDQTGSAPADNQVWWVKEIQGRPGEYVLFSIESNKVADISDNSTANGALLHLWEKTGADNQTFQFSKYVP